jgi:uncharacterized damage-inducible protein DinB
MEATSIRPFYADWEAFNRHIVDVVRAMTDEQLTVKPAPQLWPIWATVGHTAGTRVYWLCAVLGEPGAETTPFWGPDGLQEEGWEDDLEHPRHAAELTVALETTWAVVAGVLDRWTADMLGETVIREYAGIRRPHTRQSILLRMLSHDAYHAGELSQTLGIHGLPQIDLWPPEDHPAL